MKAAYVVDIVRTPIGKFGGALSSVRPDDLLSYVIKAIVDRNPSIDVNDIGDVIAGAANQAGEDNRNVARMASLLAGLPVSIPGTTVNRLCASGLAGYHGWGPASDMWRFRNRYCLWCGEHDQGTIRHGQGGESHFKGPRKFMIQRLAGGL